MKKILVAGLFLSFFLNSFSQMKFTDTRDGNIYRIITSEGVTWMAENLRYKALEGTTTFNNDPNNLQVYGLLYDWKAASKACPDGWHLPLGKEFQILIDHIDMGDGWGSNASDTTSFGIQLSGMQDYEGTYSEMDESGYYWTSTEYDKDHAQYFSYLLIIDIPIIDLSRKEDLEDIHGTEKSNKYSVRCVKN
jgi:uncharacterized protein (TIGR02145 family)